MPEHPLPERLQITTPLPGPLAENCSVAPGFNCGALGATVSPEDVEAATMVADALADFVGDATDVAVMVTLGIAGTLVGAEYTPEVEIDPHAEPVQPVPAIDHFTDVFVVPVTFAEKPCCPPALT